jgi:glycosyltransferase involved in cell wall biosynthesis
MRKKKRVIVSVTNDLYTDQRVHKVCLFLHKNNFEVHLVGRKLKNSPPMNERPYHTKRMRLLFNKGPFFYVNYNLRLFFYLLFRRADILLSNDLDSLLANFLAYKLKRNCKLVYDSHELYTEVPELINRPLVRSVWLSIEKWIFPKLKWVYTVNQSIADIYQEKYNVKVRVVRNVSSKWKAVNIPSKEELGIPVHKNLVILQGAGINMDRGAEEAVESMQYIDNAVFMIVGSGDVIPDLKQKVKELELENKVVFYGRQPYEKLMFYTYHADLGLTLDKNTNENYRFSLPNKVFDYVHATTPILASNLPEIKKFIKYYKVGDVIDSHDPQRLAERITGMLSDQKRMEDYKNNCRNAAQNESWENECKVLEKVFFD